MRLKHRLNVICIDSNRCNQVHEAIALNGPLEWDIYSQLNACVSQAPPTYQSLSLDTRRPALQEILLIKLQAKCAASLQEKNGQGDSTSAGSQPKLPVDASDQRKPTPVHQPLASDRTGHTIHNQNGINCNDRSKIVFSIVDSRQKLSYHKQTKSQPLQS
ncbi:hypothetical protein RRG08_007260 [Elysia crispata]|uniref:Uncharacterized protein n=1 Tax=Elysia crispata TaxID=231223 RepID=A0AAE1DLI3_9GAST|nr:hypothetical protein RRG08_007260 [Elysia crispata]